MKEKKINYRIKKGDTIKVITGEKKGFIGKIESVIGKKSLLFIEGIAPRIKYAKKTANTESQKIEVKVPIHISNVMPWDTKVNVTSKIGYKMVNNKKVRYFKKSGTILSVTNDS